MAVFTLARNLIIDTPIRLLYTNLLPELSGNRYITQPNLPSEGTTMTNTKLPTVIVAHSDLARVGLERAILKETPPFQIIASTTTVKKTFTEVASQPPYVLLLSPFLDRYLSYAELVSFCRSTKVVMWPEAIDIIDARIFLSTQIQGCISQRDSVETTIYALVAVSQNKPFVTPTLLQSLLKLKSKGCNQVSLPLPELAEMISPRELEVFELVGQGLKNQEIASRLKLSVKTIETHKDSIRTKLFLDNSLRLQRLATWWVHDHDTCATQRSLLEHILSQA